MKYQVIIITGQIAALKTTIARKLEKDLQAYLLCKDDIKEELAKNINTSNREENAVLSKVTVSMMQFFLLSMCKHINRIIIEANFKRGEYNNLIERLKASNISYITFYFHGSFQSLYNRYLRRLETINPIHRSMGLINEKEFQESMEYYHEIYHNKNDIITIDTTDFTNEDYEALKDRLS
jgi:RNase adaptor protein for sRNA GlmZ degradation